MQDNLCPLGRFHKRRSEVVPGQKQSSQEELDKTSICRTCPAPRVFQYVLSDIIKQARYGPDGGQGQMIPAFRVTFLTIDQYINAVDLLVNNHMNNLGHKLYV